MDTNPTQTPLPLPAHSCPCRPVKWFYGETAWPLGTRRSAFDWTYTGACAAHGQPGAAVPAELITPPAQQPAQEAQP